MQARDEFASRPVAMNAAKHVAARNRNVVLHKVVVYAFLSINSFIVDFDVFAAKILEIRRRLNK
jgi:hypothetical protein